MKGGYLKSDGVTSARAQRRALRAVGLLRAAGVPVTTRSLALALGCSPNSAQYVQNILNAPQACGVVEREYSRTGVGVDAFLLCRPDGSVTALTGAEGRRLVRTLKEG